ncbi:hypothetical protein [Paraliomyxa miuraensis]|uniref:hypothetical protein n=1 Tax=Paraliomyxa miuraensis TaxID=376150 RepID=UPI002253CD09|nr:hypothetical protein [Paraliomyxa miuraensis]MCX4239113.1 hypothetical protein [Paraliomyxa miuraensis]
MHVGPGQTYTTIGAAVSSFDMMTEGTIIVHQANYDEAVTVDGGRVLALLANAGDTPTLALIAGGAPQITVGDATVLLDGLRLSGNADDVGLVVDGGQAWVDRTRIVQNSGGGLVAQNAAELTLRNCFVGGGTDVIGVEVVDASASVLYSTISASTFGMTPALSCTTPLAVDVRNSIIVSQGGTSPDELSCAAATIVATATEANVGPFSAGWFVNFNGGDYHLTASGTSAFADVANWNTGDPSTDIDGDPRPSIDGTADHAGADVP